MEEKKYLRIAIFICFIFLGVVISPFLSTLILSAILVTGTTPIHSWVLKKVHGKDRLAAILMASSIGIIFSVAFFVFFALLSQEAVSTYQEFENSIREGKFNLHQFINRVSTYIGIEPSEIISSITQAAQTFSATLVTQSTNLLKSIVWLLVNFFLLVFSMYFFFKEGRKFISIIESVLPMPKEFGHEIFQKFKQVSLAMLYGIFLTAILQGILGGIGLAIAGIENPIFWGTAMGFLGMIPVFGTGIIWLPAGLYLIFNNHVVAGIGLLLWGGLIVALIDNMVKPLVISKQANISPLATFLVILGGLLVFGLKGAIIAPMVLVTLVSLMHFDRLEPGVQES